MGDKETVQRISAEIKALSARYIADNSWFRFYSGSGLDPMAPESYADAAGRAYVHVQKSVVPILLGDTKLRSDQELVSNFGLSDGESGSAAPEPGPGRPGVPVIPIAGASMASAAASARPPASANPANPGGILSNAKWSPMLNDAFILGGINSNKQFVFA